MKGSMFSGFFTRYFIMAIKILAASFVSAVVAMILFWRPGILINDPNSGSGGGEK